MGLFDKITDTLGLSGSKRSGRDASRQLFQIGETLRNFTPIRMRTAAGTGTFGPGGVDLDLDPRLTAGAGAGFDFFGGQMDKLAAFDEGDATARMLGLLRQRRAPAFQSNLGRLESRLMQQGRLGLSTGARAENPEMAGFFGAEAMADLESQIIAAEEARRERAGLLQSAGGGLQLALEASMPSQFMAGLFDTAGLLSARDFAAANIQAGGPALQFEGAEADRAARANFFGDAAGAVATYFSDQRLKRNIRRIGTHPIGVGVYAYDYVWGEPAIGVMADEVKQVKPHAVIRVLGFDAVDYGAL